MRCGAEPVFPGALVANALIVASFGLYLLSAASGRRVGHDCDSVVQACGAAHIGRDDAAGVVPPAVCTGVDGHGVWTVSRQLVDVALQVVVGVVLASIASNCSATTDCVFAYFIRCSVRCWILVVEHATLTTALHIVPGPVHPATLAAIGCWVTVDELLLGHSLGRFIVLQSPDGFHGCRGCKSPA